MIVARGMTLGFSSLLVIGRVEQNHQLMSNSVGDPLPSVGVFLYPNMATL